MKTFVIAVSCVVLACSASAERVGSTNQASTYICGSGSCDTACNAQACSDASESCFETGGDIVFGTTEDPNVLTRDGQPACDCNVTCGPRSGAGGCGDGCFWNSDCLNGLSCMGETCWAASCYDSLGGGGGDPNDPWEYEPEYDYAY